MGNGNNCCAKRTGEVDNGANGGGWGFKGMKHALLERSVQSFMDEHSFEKLQSNCNGGIVENYICQCTGANLAGGKSKARLLQSIEMGTEKMGMAVA